MKNFSERVFKVKNLKRDVTDLQTEIDYLEMKKGRINEVLNDESQITINLGSLKKLIRSDARLHSGLSINHLHRFSNDDGVTFKELVPNNK